MGNILLQHAFVIDCFLTCRHMLYAHSLDDVGMLVRVGHEDIFSGAKETVGGAFALGLGAPSRTDNGSPVLLEACPVAFSPLTVQWRSAANLQDDVLGGGHGRLVETGASEFWTTQSMPPGDLLPGRRASRRRSCSTVWSYAAWRPWSADLGKQWPRLCLSRTRRRGAGIWEGLDLIIYTTSVMTVSEIRDYYQEPRGLARPARVDYHINNKCARSGMDTQTLEKRSCL